MAGGAVLLDFNDKGIFVAVGVDGFDFLGVPGGLAFHPIFLTASGPEVRLAGLDGIAERVGVHIGDHKEFAGGIVGDYSRDQAIGVKLRRQDNVFHAPVHFCYVEKEWKQNYDILKNQVWHKNTSNCDFHN